MLRSGRPRERCHRRISHLPLLIAGCAALLLEAALLVPALAQSSASGSSWQTEINGGQPSRRARATPPADTKPATAARDAATKQIRATAASLAIDGDRTVFHLQLSAPAAVQAYTLASPSRVVLDLADVSFHLPPTAGRQGKGAVSGFRYGLMSAGQSRVMLDLAWPVRVEAAEWRSDASGGTALVLRLAPTDEATFEREASLPLPDKPPEPAHEAVPSAPSEGKRKRPVVVIDAGHGGVDPGAIGATDITEKSIVLAVAQQVRAMLPSQRYSVVMTRTEDVYVGLDARLAVSQRAEADLFISIHADAIDARFAQSVRGASIYTLSERASNEEARLLAEKENAADTVAGLASVPDAERDNVKGILIDLMKRETANFSYEFSRLLVGRLGNALSLARDPQRSAAFKVLKQTQSPSVLIELGYMTNAEDERQMRTPEWQRKVASAIAGAIEAYFTKRTAGAP